MKHTVFRIAVIFALLAYATALMIFAADRPSRAPSQVTREQLLEQYGFQDHLSHEHSTEPEDYASGSYRVFRSSTDIQAAGDLINSGTQCAGFCPVQGLWGVVESPAGKCGACGAALVAVGGCPNAHSASLITGGSCPLLPLGDGITELVILAILYFVAVLVRKYRSPFPRK
jgi:hypothetical protein